MGPVCLLMVRENLIALSADPVGSSVFGVLCRGWLGVPVSGALILPCMVGLSSSRPSNESLRKDESKPSIGNGGAWMGPWSVAAGFTMLVSVESGDVGCGTKSGCACRYWLSIR